MSSPGRRRRSRSTTRVSTRRNSSGSASIARPPRSARVSTRRSSTSRWRRSDSAEMSSMRDTASSGSPFVPRRARIWVSPRIVVIGVRSSCEITSMNASRNAPACRSSSSSWSRSASRRRRSVMSVPVPTMRIGVPSASRKTRPTPWVQCSDPSAQTMRNSRLNDCPAASTWSIALRNAARSSGWIVST